MSSADSAILTPRQKRLVRQSFEPVKDYAESVVLLFYGRLFELEPELRTLFKTDIGDQSRKLLDMLTTIVEALDHFEELRPKLAELGRRHVSYGTQPRHYDVVRAALLWALGHALEFEFDQETKAAWDQVLRAVSAAMLEPVEAAQS